MDGLSQRNYKTKIKNRDRAIMAVSGAINRQNMTISGAINCQNIAISGAINSQTGRQILYLLTQYSNFLTVFPIYLLDLSY